MANGGWIGVDLDGTLAEYHGWKGPDLIGPPVEKMVARVVRWLEEGGDVRVMTARVSPAKGNEADVSRKAIEKWLRKYVYPRCAPLTDIPAEYHMEITHEKDYEMVELWDDEDWDQVCLDQVSEFLKRANAEHKAKKE